MLGFGGLLKSQVEVPFRSRGPSTLPQAWGVWRAGGLPAWGKGEWPPLWFYPTELEGTASVDFPLQCLFAFTLKVQTGVIFFFFIFSCFLTPGSSQAAFRVRDD